MSKKKKWLDIRQMSEPTRWAFIGTGIVIIVLACFMAGLGIDYLLKQEATIAVYGIWLGVALSILFCWLELRKLIKK